MKYMHNDFFILNSTWFTNSTGLVGIVLTKNRYGEYKAYIGTGKGEEERVDEIEIALHGSRFPLGAAKEFFGIRVLDKS